MLQYEKIRESELFRNAKKYWVNKLDDYNFGQTIKDFGELDVEAALDNIDFALAQGFESDVPTFELDNDRKYLYKFDVAAKDSTEHANQIPGESKAPLFATAFLKSAPDKAFKTFRVPEEHELWTEMIGNQAVASVWSSGRGSTTHYADSGVGSGGDAVTAVKQADHEE